MNVKNCFRCDKIHPSDNMTPDGFGDSHVLMCDNCMREIANKDSKYALVKTPEYCGTTFVLRNELSDLIELYGEKNIDILN